MKLFISWSGERSQILAQGLHDWIPLVLHYVEPWLSEADIEAGERWAEAVAKELEASNFGIICITKENVNSSWILFEAGALAKSIQGSRVIPLLLDLEFRDITGPLAQFQAKKVDKAGVSEVIHSINQSITPAIPEARAKQLFEALWPEFEKHLKSIPKDTSPAKHTRPQHEILEELVTSIRSLDARFREVSEESPRAAQHRRLRFHPFFVEELMHIIGEKPGDPIAILIISSIVRDEIPWLYELGIEAYRSAKSGSPDDAKRTMQRFIRAADFITHGPIGEELGFDMKTFHMVRRMLDHLIREREPIKEEEPITKTKRRREIKQD